MRVEIVLPALGASCVVSYMIVYRVLEIRDDTVRWITAASMAILFTYLFIKAFVGEIRPFYAVFAAMVVYLFVQRRLQVRRPNTDGETVVVE